MFFFYFLVLFYFITFTPKWFALAVAAVSAKLRAILLYNMCKILQFLCRFVNSVHDGQFYRRLPILHAILIIIGGSSVQQQPLGLSQNSCFTLDLVSTAMSHCLQVRDIHITLHQPPRSTQPGHPSGYQ